MSVISASTVKDLREKTGAGMMDCKKALAETNGDLEAAVDWLRKKGLAAAAKKSGRVAAEGLVAVAGTGTAAAIVEINAETDFVARNEQFQAFVKTAAELAVASTDIESLKAAQYPGTGRTVADELTQLIATIGENMTMRRSQTLTVSQGLVATYIHGALQPGLGKIGVIVALESAAPADKLAEFGKQLAMHIAAASPEALHTTDVDQTKLDRERDVLSEQARASGKPEEIIAKMVDGRLRKYYEEVVLHEQLSVLDGETKIAKLIETAGKAAGSPIKVTGFVRYKLGEGIEKQETDFAAEVKSMAG